MTFKEHIAEIEGNPFPSITTIPRDTKVTFHRYCPGVWHFAFDGITVGSIVANTDKPDRVWYIQTKWDMDMDIGQDWAYFASFKNVKEHIKEIVETQNFYDPV